MTIPWEVRDHPYHRKEDRLGEEKTKKEQEQEEEKEEEIRRAKQIHIK